MSNIYLKVTIEKIWRSQNFDFLSLKNLFQPTQISLIFKTSCYNLKIKGLGAKLGVELWHFEVKESLHFLNKNINFNKNETESKMENPTQF